WNQTQMPHMNGAKDEIRGLAVASANDIWAVGSFVPAPNAKPIPLMHWDGQTWNTVSNMSPIPVDGRFTDVAALSPTDAWAVGYVDEASGQGLALHWNGRDWKGVELPNYSGPSGLNSVAVV